MKSLSLRGIVTAIGAAVALVTAVSLPVGTFVSGYLHLSQHLDFKAELNASYLAKYISGHVAFWQFQRVRIAELLSQTDGSDTSFQKRVVDASNKMVIEEGDAVPAPTLVRRQPVSFAGSTVAHVELEASLRPLLKASALAAAFGALLGLGIFFAIRIFPLRALDRTMGLLERTNGRFDAAITNMSHGLSMFDAEGRLLVHNEHYCQMYDLTSEVVKPGCTLLEILKFRAAQSPLNGDPSANWEKLQITVKDRKSGRHIATSSNGREIAVSHTPMANGG